ncbi:uncharacterized protein BDZ83DRAFT_563004, partial [Colletotrichum acutatum]
PIALASASGAHGRFSCPHWTKTYFHAKDLKRHLPLHTGDRPYERVLCHDTSSQKNTLKCRSQKRSIRRINPTGANHLSHP